ncbi:MAG: prephenate dehydrogenase/arogenate dehydrogenase family protein [Planctomycetaceae bacterium]|nr:prephenate dehydrogenase/arogenate dehydrogenase family protein [Planctomycetaceae bacterium]
MRPWDTVAIVGVGLMGGSIGLALQQRKLARRVVGVGRRVASLRKARECGTVTETTTRLERGVAEADLIIVCTPVADIVDRVCEAARHCPPEALITDVGSTKSRIVRELERRLRSGPAFIGSHPMAGSEKTGPAHARADLLVERVTVVTPTPRTRDADVERIERFWAALGARVVRMTPLDHDQAVAMTSHATHLVAAALAAATPACALSLAASGWQDTTRIAAGDPQLWVQILLANRPEVLKSLGQFEKSLATFRAALARGDATRLLQLLDAGKQTRDSVGS